MNWLTSRIAPAALLASFALAACDKGTDLSVDLPDTASISTNYLEVPLPTATVQLDSVETLKSNRYLVGRLTDNVAGTTAASAYFNTIIAIKPDSLPAKFGRSQLDSVVVIMTFDQVYGSASRPGRFDVYSLQDKLDEREVYNSARTPATGVLLASNVEGRLNRTREVSGGTPAVVTTAPDPTLRLVLYRRSNPGSVALFNDLYNAMLQQSFNQAALDAVLKGLVIKPSASYEGAIVSFGRTTVPRLEMYFHEDLAPVGKWHAYPIAFGPVYSSRGEGTAKDPRYFTQISTDLTTGTELRVLNGSNEVPASATSNNVSYLQEGVGLGTVINLAGLTQLQGLRGKPGLAINRAELRVGLKPYRDVLFPNPNGIFALEANSNNRVLKRIVDFSPIDRAVQTDGANPRGITSEAFSGPALNSATAAPYYSLLITNYLQAYLNNNLDGPLPAKLILVPNIRRSLIRESALGLNRAVVDGNNVTLYIYYSQQ